MTHRLLAAARAEALFTSALPTGSNPEPVQVDAAIRRAVRLHRGTRGCATELAGAYGDSPETAAPRMRWALAVVEHVYAKPGPDRGMHWSLRASRPGTPTSIQTKSEWVRWTMPRTSEEYRT